MVDVVVNTSYLHEFRGLAFDAKDRNSGLSSVEVVQAQCFLQSEDHRQDNAAISTFGKSPSDHTVASDGPLCWLGRPCDGLWHPSLCSFVGAMEALPGLALTSMLTEQLGNFGKGTLCRSFQAVLLASMLMAKG